MVEKETDFYFYELGFGTSVKDDCTNDLAGIVVFLDIVFFYVIIVSKLGNTIMTELVFFAFYVDNFTAGKIE